MLKSQKNWKRKKEAAFIVPQASKQLTSHLVRHSALAWLPCKRKPDMTKGSTQACQWNPLTFSKISQPWQSDWLSISGKPPHQQLKLPEFRCKITVIQSSQRSRIIKVKEHRMRAKSKQCLNTKQCRLNKAQNNTGFGKSKDPSASWSRNTWNHERQDAYMNVGSSVGKLRMLFTSW